MSTTSSKPLLVIRDNIVRVLDNLDIIYHDIRGSWNCRFLSEFAAIVFEIIIGKIPFVLLHGIRCKKVTGNDFQYNDMVRKVLDRFAY